MGLQRRGKQPWRSQKHGTPTGTGRGGGGRKHGEGDRKQRHGCRWRAASSSFRPRRRASGFQIQWDLLAEGRLLRALMGGEHENELSAGVGGRFTPPAYPDTAPEFSIIAIAAETRCPGRVGRLEGGPG